MSRFSALLMDHFQSPRHHGRLESPTVVGVAGFPGEGRFVVLYLRIEGNVVVDASFLCNGCGVTVACGSALTEELIGRRVAECRELTPERLIEALDGVPLDKRDRAHFALQALSGALDQLETGRGAGRPVHSPGETVPVSPEARKERG